MKSRLPILQMLVIAALVATARPASAQQPPPGPQAPGGQTTRPTRPNRGLFAGGIGDTSQSLFLRVSLGGAYVEDLTPGGRPPRQDGTGSANLTYSLSREFGRLSLGASAASSAYYFPAASDDVINSQRAELNASFRITNRTLLSVQERFAYLPHRVNSFFPSSLAGQTGTGVLDPTVFDPVFGITSDNYLNVTSRAMLSQQVTRRGSLNFDYMYSENTRTAAAGRNEYQSARLGYSHNLAKGLSARLGYRADRRNTGVATANRWRGRSIDAGIDFNRSLSISRRMTVGFSTGATGLDNNVVRRYFVTGAAHVNHEIGRSWTATLSYRREVHFIDTVVDPLLGDSVTFGVSGLLSRRLELSGNVGARNGQFGISSGSPEFRSSHGRVNLSIALSRYLAINTDYSYFRYRFGSGALLPLTIRPRIERQSVRITLSAWVPLIVRTRRTNAPG